MSKGLEINEALSDLVVSIEQELHKAVKDEEKRRARYLRIIKLYSKDLLNTHEILKHYPVKRLKQIESLFMDTHDGEGLNLLNYSYGPLQEWWARIPFGQLISEYETELRKDPTFDYNLWYELYS